MSVRTSPTVLLLPAASERAALFGTGYRKIGIRPRPGGGITHATTRHLTPYGMAEVAWRIENGTMHLDATVPTGTTATVELPGGLSRELGPGKHRLTVPIK